MNVADISDEEWTAIMNRLTLHADNKLRRLRWRGVSGRQGGTPAGGIRAEDLASDAILDLLEGRRVWNQDQEPELLNWLRDVVDSKVSHLVERKENRVARRFLPEMDDADMTAVSHNVVSPDQRPPDEQLSEMEEVTQLCDSIRTELAGDEVASQLLQFCMDGVSKPAEMAVLLQLPVQTIYDAQKRLRRSVERTILRRQRTG